MKYLYTTLLAVFVFFSYAQQAAFYEGKQNTDGKSDDWTFKELIRETKYGFVTGVKNDEENLYIIFQCDNPRMVTKAMMAGMSFSIKSKSKPKINAKIEYPLKGDLDQVGGPMGAVGQMTPEQREIMMEERMNRLIDSKYEVSLKGFSTVNGDLMITQTRALQLAMGMAVVESRPQFNYEIAIPLTELFGKELNWKRMTSSTLAMSFSIEGLNDPSTNGSSSRYTRTGGRGGGGVGRSRAGLTRGMGPNSDIFATQTVKFNYTIKQ